jgi:YVTN family beta-propeller protein
MSNSVSVIDTATNTVVATIAVGSRPFGVAVSPDGLRVYVANYAGSSVSVIDTAANAVIATVPLASLFPIGIAVSPDGSRVYVTHEVTGDVSVIDTATYTVVATIPVGVPGDDLTGIAVNPVARGFT